MENFNEKIPINDIIKSLFDISINNKEKRMKLLHSDYNSTKAIEILKDKEINILVAHENIMSNFSKAQRLLEVYSGSIDSEYKELSHLIYAFNDIMEKEFLLNKDYFKSSLIFSKIIETNNNLKEINELEIIKTAFNSLKGIFPDKYIIVDLKLVKTSAVALKLKELINLYLIHKKEDIKSVLSFENNYWFDESIDIINKQLDFNDRRYI